MIAETFQVLPWFLFSAAGIWDDHGIHNFQHLLGTLFSLPNLPKIFGLGDDILPWHIIFIELMIEFCVFADPLS